MRRTSLAGIAHRGVISNAIPAEVRDMNAARPVIKPQHIYLSDDDNDMPVPIN